MNILILVSLLFFIGYGIYILVKLKKLTKSFSDSVNYLDSSIPFLIFGIGMGLPLWFVPLTVTLTLAETVVIVFTGIFMCWVGCLPVTSDNKEFKPSHYTFSILAIIGGFSFNLLHFGYTEWQDYIKLLAFVITMGLFTLDKPRYLSWVEISAVVFIYSDLLFLK